MEKLKFLRKKRMLLLRLAFAPLVFICLFVYRSWQDQSIIDFICEWSGYVLILVGLALRLWAILYISQLKTKQLIVNGPFSICRNPLYVGSFIITIGVCLSFENIVLLAAALFITIPIHVAVILAEENHLANIFGQAYEQYKRQVPRFWFRFSNFKTPELIQISPKAIHHVLFQSILILLVPALGDLIELLHANGILPVLWYY